MSCSLHIYVMITKDKKITMSESVNNIFDKVSALCKSEIAI